jgi:hypothetical protein
MCRFPSFWLLHGQDPGRGPSAFVYETPVLSQAKCSSQVLNDLTEQILIRAPCYQGRPAAAELAKLSFMASCLSS